MKANTSIVLLLVLLTACVPVITPFPSVVPPAISATIDIVPADITPSSVPTQIFLPIITPDAVQLARWKEYQNALASALFPPDIISQSPDEFLCEWEILGRSDQEVYVWTVCMSTFPVGNSGLHYNMEMPATIHVEIDGAVQSVEIPRGGTHYASDIRQMFPADAQEKYFSRLIHFQELTDHLRWRLEHPEEPPLIVLSATPTP